MKYIIYGIALYIVSLIALISITKKREDKVTDDEYEEFISYIEKYKKNKKK